MCSLLCVRCVLRDVCVVCCALFGGCCWMLAVCCLLCAVCWPLVAVCCLLSDSCVSFVVNWLMSVVC